MTNLSEFRRWIIWLRRHFPSDYPVSIRRSSLATLRKTHADAPTTPNAGFTFDPVRERFTIRLAETLNESESFDSLFHEWSHVLREHIPTSRHDAADGEDEIFDAIYGKIRRTWFNN